MDTTEVVYAFRYPDGSWAALDLSSGGYAYKVSTFTLSKIFTAPEVAKEWGKHFPELQLQEVFIEWEPYGE